MGRKPIPGRTSLSAFASGRARMDDRPLSHSRPYLWGLWGTLAATGLALGGAWWRSAGGGLPACLFRVLTGTPCPTCGSTRLLLALGQGEGWRAWHWNPLLFAGLLALAGWGLLGLASWLTGWRGEPRLRRWLDRRRGFWLALLVTAGLANWIYLWRHLQD